MSTITNLESKDTRTLIRVLEDYIECRTKMRIRKELTMRDYDSYKEMATNELNHNIRIKERLDKLKASNERDREKIEKISSMNGTIKNGTYFKIKSLAEAQLKQFSESLQVKKTNLEKSLEELVNHYIDSRPLVKAHKLKQGQVAALEATHQNAIDEENDEKERMKLEKLTFETLFQQTIVEFADYVRCYHGIADEIEDLHKKTATEPNPSKSRAPKRPKPSQLSPSSSSQNNQMMPSTSSHKEAIVSSKKRKVADFVPSDSGFGRNLAENEGVTVMNGTPGISSEKHIENNMQMVNDENVVIQESDEIANVRMDANDDANVNPEIDESSSSYDIAAILQDSINYAKALNIDVNSDTEYDEESIELLK